MLTQATIQAQNATISAQTAHIKYLQIQNFEIAKPDSKSEETDSEPLISDIVTIDKYKGTFFSVNLASLLRRLKRRFNSNS